MRAVLRGGMEAVAGQVNQQVSAAVTVVRDLQSLADSLRRLDRVDTLVGARAAAPGAAAPPDRLCTGIGIENVTFAYGQDGEPTLRDVSVFLPAGKTVAIVGENGSGKTTLVKLLCGLHLPTSGRILVDGADLRTFDASAWRHKLAAGFQDFVRFELPALHVVGIGDLPRRSDARAVATALRRAGADDVVGTLDDGLDTRIGKSYTDGVELSGGQWQKLALGRAFMRDEPLLLLLDEPTAALDAETEHALFERYAERARRLGRQTGAVTVFVTHRFSTVRAADLIIVLADGAIAEVGGHAELMRAQGLYAELYALQAESYRVDSAG